MPEHAGQTILLEMGYTHEEFIRTLKYFMDGQPFSISGPRISISQTHGQVNISLGTEGERRIGPNLRLPITPVEIVFSGYSEGDQKLFMTRFEMIFRKGGG